MVIRVKVNVNVNGQHFGNGSMAFYYIGNNVNVGTITSDSYNSCVGLAIYRNRLVATL